MAGIGNLTRDQMLELLKKMLSSKEIAKGGKALEKEMEKQGYGKRKWVCKQDILTKTEKLLLTAVRISNAFWILTKSENIEGHNRKSDMRLAGSIPFVVIEMWMKECGAKLGSQELNEYIKKKLMSGEFSKLVANGY